jgi:esterase/lipase superfamily enzyme
MKTVSEWWSPRLRQWVKVARWGHYGSPLLLFPTAGGDAEECERFLMVQALEPLLAAGRIKLYCCDSVAGRAWLSREGSGRHRAWLQNQFDGFVYAELVPAIRLDCRTPDIEILTAGASIGAFNALASICRHPDAFRTAICMSGTYDLSPWLDGEWSLDYLPGLGDGEQLDRLRGRFVLLATGEGRWEDPGQSWRVASVLGGKGIPNRVDLWGAHYDHDWVTWREMLPHYLAQLA